MKLELLLEMENLTASKMNYLEKIKALSKISITQVCKELNINRSNLLNNKTTIENQKLVYEKLISKYEAIKKQ